MFYGPIHSTEECATVLYQAVKVHFLKEVTLSLTEIICVKPSHRQIMKMLNDKPTLRGQLVQLPVNVVGPSYKYP